MVILQADEKSVLLEAVVKSAPIGMVALDENLNIVLVNPRGRNYLNIDQQDNVTLSGKPVLAITPEPLKGKLLEKLADGKLNFDLPEIKLGQRYVVVRCRPVMKGVLLTFMNISKSKEMEAAAYNAMLEGQESERRRFAQEMHDGIGPLLSSIKLNIEHLQPTDGTLGPEVAARFENVIGMIDQLTQEVRSMSHALMPAALLDFGLDAALQQLCNRVSMKGKTKVVFYSNEPDRRIDPSIELGLYRIGQELLNNALKYAQAKEVSVQIIRHGNSVVLMVEDDGQGFDLKELKTKLGGIGFINIQARAKSLKGHFTIESAPGDGVLATVEVPISS